MASFIAMPTQIQPKVVQSKGRLQSKAQAPVKATAKAQAPVKATAQLHIAQAKAKAKMTQLHIAQAKANMCWGQLFDMHMAKSAFFECTGRTFPYTGKKLPKALGGFTHPCRHRRWLEGGGLPPFVVVMWGGGDPPQRGAKK